MKKHLALVGLIFLSLVIQTTALGELSLPLAKPDLLLIITVYLGLYSKPLAGAILVFLSGYLMDIFSGSIFGVQTFSKTAIFFLTILIKAGFVKKSSQASYKIGFSPESCHCARDVTAWTASQPTHDACKCPMWACARTCREAASRSRAPGGCTRKRRRLFL